MKPSRLLAKLVLATSISTSLLTQASELPRSTLLGIMPEQTGNNQSVVLHSIIPNSTASKLGLQAGDKILNINDQDITGFGDVISAVRTLRADHAIEVTIERDDKKLTKSGLMQPRPYERSEHAEVIYDVVSYEGNKLRSIVYKPNTLKEKAPAIFFIQGYTCGSIDMGIMPEATTKQLVDQFAAAGYVTFRVEKPGVGDSQSERNCDQIDFTTESIAFTEALKQLKKKPFVDPDRVYLWGHSLGVLHSAVVAKNEPVAGVIGYGGVLKPWYDYMLDIYRHQSVKHFGASKWRAKRNTALVKPVLDMWLNSDKKWVEIVADKATKAAMDADMISINGDQVVDRHYSFFRDLNRYDLVEYWKSIDAPLLMMHGSLDIQAIEKNWAFDLISLSSHKHSKALEIQGAEHSLMQYDSPSQYREAMNNGTFNPASPGQRFDHRIGEHTLTWLASLPAAKGAM